MLGAPGWECPRRKLSLGCGGRQEEAETSQISGQRLGRAGLDSVLTATALPAPGTGPLSTVTIQYGGRHLAVLHCARHVTLRPLSQQPGISGEDTDVQGRDVTCFKRQVFKRGTKFLGLPRWC